MFIIHLNSQNMKKKKTLLPKILVIKTIFSRKLGVKFFSLLYLWAKYEPIWKQFTAHNIDFRCLPAKSSIIIFKVILRVFTGYAKFQSAFEKEQILIKNIDML